MAKKQRNHNEYIQPLASNRCPNCLDAKGHKVKTPVYAWGEYVNAKWRTVKHFCLFCFAKEVLYLLEQHAWQCGCKISVVARSGYRLPEWMPVEFPLETRDGGICTTN